MAITVPCPQCGKTLKLLETLLGKTIRCPSCQQIFKAPHPSPREEIAEVLPADVSPAPNVFSKRNLKDPPIVNVAPGDTNRESRKTPTAKRGWGAGVLLVILAAVLVLCGGFATLAFFVGKAVVAAISKPVISSSPIASSPATPQPNPNPIPPPQPNPNPNPNPNPKPSPKPNFNPQPLLTPKGERLTRVGDRLTIDARGTQMVRTVPDGKQLAVVGEDGVVKLLKLPQFGKDPLTYEVERTFPAVEGPIRDLAFHPSSQMAIVAGDHVYVYNSYTQKLDAKLTYKEPIAAVFQPAGLHLAIAVRKPDGQGSEIHLWDTRRKRDNGKPLKLTGKVSDIAWPSGTYDLAVAVDDEVRLYHTPDRDWRYDRHHHHTAGIYHRPGLHAEWSKPRHDRQRQDNQAWTQKDGKFLRAYEGATNPIGRPAFTPDGSRLAVLGGPGDESVHLWHTATGKPLGTLVNTPAQGGNLDFLRDNRTLVIALRKQAIRFWSIPDAAVRVQPAPPPRFGKAEQPEEANRFNVGIAIQMVGFSPDGKTLAASGREGELLLLNVADWTRRAVLTSASGPRRRGRGPALTFAYAGEGRLVCAGGGGKSARVYLRDGVSGELQGDFPAGDGWVRSLAVSPDGKRVAVGLESRAPLRLAERPRKDDTALVRLWDISAEPKQLGTLEKLPFPLGGLAFDRDGKTLYIAAGKLVHRWRPDTREELPAWDGALSDLAAVVVAADGRVYAAGEDLLDSLLGRRGAAWGATRRTSAGPSVGRRQSGGRLGSGADDRRQAFGLGGGRRDVPVVGHGHGRDDRDYGRQVEQRQCCRRSAGV